MTDYAEWLGIQSGLQPYRKQVFDPALRYIRNGRDLAQFVHYDYTYQALLQALIVLNQFPDTLLDYNTYQAKRHKSPQGIEDSDRFHERSTARMCSTGWRVWRTRR